MTPRRVFSLTVTKEWEGRRVDEVLRAALGMSARQIRAVKRRRGFFLDGVCVYANAVVRQGQRLEAVDENDYDQGIAPEEEPLTIVYEDEHLLVVDKPAPLATLPTAEKPRGTLAGRVAAHVGEERFIFRPVNRLDRGTSGLMVVARHALAQKRLMEALHTESFLREYLALCQGVMEEDAGCIDAPIGRAPGDGVRRCVREDGKPSRTDYAVLTRFFQTNRTLLSLRLHTGRTHQIRVHLMHIGHPVVGDPLYGQMHPDLQDRFALHAARLRLVHPFTGETLDFSSPMPQQVRALYAAP